MCKLTVVPRLMTAVPILLCMFWEHPVFIRDILHHSTVCLGKYVTLGCHQVICSHRKHKCWRDGLRR